MPRAHRQGDQRFCGSVTVVSGQSTVYINGVLAAVEGDESTHEFGGLIAGSSGTYINNKRVIVKGDTATIDDVFHIPPWPYPKTFSADVYINGINEPDDPDPDLFPSFLTAAEEAIDYWMGIDPELAATINATSEAETANNAWYIPLPISPEGEVIPPPAVDNETVTYLGESITYNGETVVF
jgi:hypothetical protein